MTDSNYGVTFPHRQTKHVNKLPILLSCRIRLDDKQRETLRTAYRAFKEERKPIEGEQFGGSTVRTVTAQQAPSLVNNWSDMVINDLITTRETVSITSIISIQQALNVEVITAKEVMKACEGYCDYIFNHVKAN